METLKLFSNPKFGDIRVINIDGKPYFVASDVAKVLGYKNPVKAIGDHCKGVTKRYIGVETGKKKDGSAAIQQIEVNVIPQGDIYRLAAKSELHGAEEFESWIFDDVLVSISSHGAYLTPEKIEEVLLNPDTLIRLATNLKEERLRRIEAETEIKRLQPKAELVDKIIDSEEKIDIGQAAKILGLPYGRNHYSKNYET